MSNRGPKVLKQQKSWQKAKKTTKRISLTTIILGAATLIGGIAALSALLPRVTVAVSDPVDANDPYSSSITITNTGYIPLKAVSANMCLTKIVSAGSKRPMIYLGDCDKQAIHRDTWLPHDLGLDDRFTVAMNDLFTGSSDLLVSADIAVVVQYRLPLIHIHCEKRFPLFAKRQTDGKFYWYSDAPAAANSN